MRNLTNCLIGGFLSGLLLLQATLLLNPHVPLQISTALSVGATYISTYGLVAGLGLWVALLLFEQVGGRRVSPAWLSLRLLTWVILVDLAVAGALFWHNLFVYRSYLPVPAIRALAIAATIHSAGAAILLVLGLFRYSFGRRMAWFSYASFAGVVLACVLAPFLVRPRTSMTTSPVPRLPLRDSPSSRRLTLVGVEAASMSYVLPAIAEGRLPNFARLIEGGASGALRTLVPTESLAIWTSIATGKLPRQHGLLGFYRYRFPDSSPWFSLLPRGLEIRRLEGTGLIQRSAVTSSSRRTETFWSILSSFGVRVGLVRWWGTYPAEPIQGFFVSELFYRQMREQYDPPLPDLTYPPDLANELRDDVVRPEGIEQAEIQRFVDTTVQIPDDTLAWEPLLRRALADDITHQRIGRALKQAYDPQVYAIYFFGLDTVAHTFLRYHHPESFGDVSDAELKKYGRVVDAYYSRLDTLLGEYLQSRRPDEILMVVSGHGMEPLPLARRVVEALKGNDRLFGYHERGPDGLLLFYGPGIARGTKIQGASVVDVTPTLLYLMGLPLGQDMDGTLLAGILEESVRRSEPVTFISSYSNFLIESRRAEDTEAAPSPLDSLTQPLDDRD